MTTFAGNVPHELIRFGYEEIACALQTAVFPNIGVVNIIEDWGSGSGRAGCLTLALYRQSTGDTARLVLVDEDPKWFSLEPEGDTLGRSLEVFNLSELGGLVEAEVKSLLEYESSRTGQVDLIVMRSVTHYFDVNGLLSLVGLTHHTLRDGGYFIEAGQCYPSDEAVQYIEMLLGSVHDLSPHKVKRRNYRPERELVGIHNAVFGSGNTNTVARFGLDFTTETIAKRHDVPLERMEGVELLSSQDIAYGNQLGLTVSEVESDKPYQIIRFSLPYIVQVSRRSG